MTRTMALQKGSSTIYQRDGKHTSEIQERGSTMEEIKEDMYTAEALLRAVLELIDKCETLEELRESVHTIFDVKKEFLE